MGPAELERGRASECSHDRPLLGFGWGRFPADSPRYYRQSAGLSAHVRPAQLHNVYLSNAVELGLIGALLWLVAVAVAIIGSILRRGPPALRPWKIGLLAWAICYAISALSTPLGFALPTLLLWTWAGIARGEPERAAALRATRSPKNARTTRSAAAPSSSAQKRSRNAS